MDRKIAFALIAVLAVLATRATAAQQYDVNTARPGSLTSRVEVLLNPHSQAVNAIGTTGNSRPRNQYGPPGEPPKEDFSSIQKGLPAPGGGGGRPGG
jgi:hypothetical protein